MFILLDEIDTVTELSPARASELLKVTLELEPVQTNEHLLIYKGRGELWSEVELRLPRGGDGDQFVLVLKPSISIPMSEIVSHYGGVPGFDLPNPNAGDKGMFRYVYDRQAGKLAFSFRSFEEPFAKVILFDRI